MVISEAKKKYCKEYYERNKEKINKQKAERYRRKRVEILTVHRQRRLIKKQQSKDYYHRNKKEILKRQKSRYDPVKNNARGKLQYQIKIGNIKRPEKCPECKRETKVHAHHHDYSKPLDVYWLCSICHGKRHRQFG